MADIFDHVLSVIPYFHLEAFELPNSKDFQELLLAQYNEKKGIE